MVLFEQENPLPANKENAKSSEKVVLNQKELLERAERIAELGHWRVDLSDNKVEWSEQIYRIHGVEPESYTPDLTSGINFYHEDDREFVKASIQNAVQENRDFTFEARIVRPCGEIRYVRSSGECLHDEKNQVSSIFGIFQDITKVKMAEIELLNKNLELEEFAYRASHDLRSPIISTVGLLKVLEDAVKDGQTDLALESLEHANSSLEKLQLLIQDILALTKSKHVKEERVTISVKEIIDEAIKKLSFMDNFERLTISQKLTFNQPLEIQKSRFTLILENMLSNAIKYQDLKEQSPYIKIVTTEENGEFILRIEDNGLGIPKDMQSRMFEMFARFHTNVSFGTGLGLYMMKKSAKIMKGDIIFEEPEKGCIFKLVIPLDA